MKLFKYLVLLCLLTFTLSAKLRKEEETLNNCCYSKKDNKTPTEYHSMSAGSNTTCSTGVFYQTNHRCSDHQFAENNFTKVREWKANNP